MHNFFEIYRTHPIKQHQTKLHNHSQTLHQTSNQNTVSSPKQFKINKPSTQIQPFGRQKASSNHKQPDPAWSLGKSAR